MHLFKVEQLRLYLFFTLEAGVLGEAQDLFDRVRHALAQISVIFQLRHCLHTNDETVEKANRSLRRAKVEERYGKNGRSLFDNASNSDGSDIGIAFLCQSCSFNWLNDILKVALLDLCDELFYSIFEAFQ